MKETPDRISTNRVVYYDILRIIAAFAVVLLHCSSEKWYSYEENTYPWHIFNVYDSLVRFGVPLFVMLTGSVMGNPDKECSIKKLWGKNILRLVAAYLFWHFFYIFADKEALLELKAYFPHHVRSTLEVLVKSSAHLWYMNMIICIYAIIPVLRLITGNEKILKYAVKFSILFSFVIPTVLNFPYLTEEPHLIIVINAVKGRFFSAREYHLNFEYISYFLIGYYLSTVPVGKKEAIKYGLFGLLGFIATWAVSAAYSRHTGKIYGFYGYGNINVLAEAVGMFIIVKYFASKHSFKKKTVMILTRAADCCFGAYMIHVFVIGRLSHLGFTTVAFDPVFAVPCKAVITFAVSLLMSEILHHIPLIRKYIV